MTTPFISHSQNFEDVMLRRALRNVEGGRYLDVGAAEPEADSVTKAFYDLGWHGINVEPLEGPFKRLVAARPRDVNLNVAVGATPGEASMFVVGDESGLSTLNQDFALQHEGGGWALQERRVPVTTLAEICASHVAGDLHFLKIDAEGAELDILRGADFTRWRPWIILLEAVDPVANRPSPFGDWEHWVLKPNQYSFVYDDGLNRFYVASEHEAELGPAFRVPPNVFDNFVRISEVKAGEQAGRASVDQQQARVAPAGAGCVDIKGAPHTQAAQVAHLTESLARTSVERDGWAQELFEANRHAAELVAARQMMADQLARLRQHEEWRTEEVGHLNNHLAEVQQKVRLLTDLRDELADQLTRLRRHEEWRIEEVGHLKGHIAAAQEEVQRATALHARLAAAQAEASQAAQDEALHAAQDKLQRLEAASRRELAAKQAELDSAVQELQHATQWLHAVRQSSSWRVTRPVRALLRLLGRG